MRFFSLNLIVTRMSLLRKLFARSAEPAFHVATPTTAPRAGTDPTSKETIAEGECRRIVDEASRLDTAGRHAESLALVTRALQTAPADANLLHAKGCALFAWGRSREALAAFLLAEANGLGTTPFLVDLGWAHLRAGAADEAERCMREAVAADPDAWPAHYGLAKVLQAQGRMPEAIESFERVLQRNPDEIESIINLGVCKLALSDPVAGEAQFRRAIVRDGRHANAWNNLGVALEHQRRHAEARDAYERATRIEAEGEAPGGSYVNFALSLQGEGRTREALDVLERNLARHGGADAHGNYAQALRMAGKLPEGWTHFEFRWFREPLLSNRPSLAQPMWAGQDLRGKTILLRAEQGLGDTLQFIRYTPHVKAQGATVLLSAQSALREVLRDFPGIDRMLGPEDTLPPIDYYVHLLSLPRIFASGLDSIPAGIPYVHADPVRSQRWSKRLRGNGTFNVGIVWAGRLDHIKDRDRSVSLRVLAPLGEVDGVRFHSLQKGPPAEEAEMPPPGLALVDLGAELEDFADTAAVIGELDLVISVDTAVAHLAGAMGKPVWLMLPNPAEWRWMEDREDSPWYPTMRLFRQRKRGDWADVVDRIKTALRAQKRDARENAIVNAVESPQSTEKQKLLLPAMYLPRKAPGHRPGFSAIAETRYGILQYLPDEPLVGDSIGWYGEYLQSQSSLLERMLRPGATVLEVGPGVGCHALSLSAAIGPKGHLILAEPRRMHCRMLRQNLAANRIANSTLLTSAFGKAGQQADTVDGLQLEQLDWMKLNDGMAAPAILEGAAATLWRLRPMLLIAVREEPMQGELASSAKSYGYRVWRMDTPLFDPGNFNLRPDDIFASGVATALLAIPEEQVAPASLDGCVELA